MKRLSIILSVMLFAYGVCSAKQIKGVVSSGVQKLSGVVVSDGFGFAKTDAKGAFVLELNDAAPFVYVVTPSGYTAPFSSGTPLFYLKADSDVKSYDFDLLPYGNKKGYVLLTIADPQMLSDAQFKRFETETIPELSQTSRDYEAEGVQPVGICLGDMVWDALGYVPRYKSAISTLNIPFYPVIGNHDHEQELKGDFNTEASYRAQYGPTYYAFVLGTDYYVVLDNIIYDTQKQYIEAVSEQQLKWLKGYLKYVPKGARVNVCMHAPVSKFFSNKAVLDKSSHEIINLCSNYKLSFMTGHSHINSNMDVARGVIEHNVASAGGAWWTSKCSKDGTPCGYQVFESKDGDFSWYYKSTGKDRDFQFEAYDRGTFAKKANAVVAKVWNWDKQWKVEWIEDGVDKGDMLRFDSYDAGYMRYLQKRRDSGKADVPGYKSPTKSFFYFAAVPSVDARKVEIVVTDRFGRKYSQVVDLKAVDVQAHRGGRGLMPENTTEAMINAINLGVNTLELDLGISKDLKVVVSHDPYMNYKFVTRPDGSAIEKADTRKYAIYNMPYDSLSLYETGLKPYAAFPEQKKIETHKPLVSDMIDCVEKYTTDKNLTPMNYNIEIKSSVANDNKFSPEYKQFADLVMEVLLSKRLGDRLLVQCFDVRTLNYLHAKYPEVKLSYLVEAEDTDFEANLAKLDFVPQWYSPHFSLVNKESLAKFHAKGVKVVPWTVNEPEDIKRMLELDIDSIISDYPDRILKFTRKY